MNFTCGNSCYLNDRNVTVSIQIQLKYLHLFFPNKDIPINVYHSATTDPVLFFWFHFSSSNEAWRYMGGFAKPVTLTEVFTRGLKWGFAAFVIALGIEYTLFPPKKNGGHH